MPVPPKAKPPTPKKPEKKKYEKWPVDRNRITQQYKAGHNAIDIDTGTGDKVYSPTKTKVAYAGYDATGYGNYVILEGPDKEKIYLAHFSQPPVVKAGQILNPGDVVGYSGTTGRSSGDHLHYEIRSPGGSGYLNPLDLHDTIPSSPTPPPSAGKVTTPKPGTMAGSVGVPPGTKVRKEKVAEEAAQAPDWLAGVAEGLLGPFWNEEINRFDWIRFLVVLLGAIMVIFGVYGWVQTEGLRTAAKTAREFVNA